MSDNLIPILSLGDFAVGDVLFMSSETEKAHPDARYLYPWTVLEISQDEIKMLFATGDVRWRPFKNMILYNILSNPKTPLWYRLPRSGER